MQNLGAGLIKNFMKDMIKVRLSKTFLLEPLILSYFVTFRCNLKCRYCSYSKNDYSSKYKEVNTEGAKRILETCRKGVPALAISGGEPLVREDIIEIAKFAKKLNYKPISLFTNSLLLPEKEEILEYIDYLQISLDTINEKKQDKINGKPNIGRRVKNIIKKYALLQKKKGFQINVNCVVSKDNLDDIPELMRFAKENKVRFTLCPQLDEKGSPIKDLNGKDKERYQNLINQILKDKGKNNAIFDIKPFLEHIKTFKKFDCYPSLTPRVYPNGDFIFPCPKLYKNKLNVLESGSWDKIRKFMEKEKQACKKQCFLPCYIETSLLIKHPFSLLKGTLK
jgi:MoaA/NifB/PqqE/SkfB family radical SAM enzyme